ncbi:hypothetical protein [Alkalibacillus haloalkaliphilus]|uniref:Uncharacterized protein n=1 Tax=Alkalibacillus haloalkaliphilus TaxID=94136 RepID=A0A511W6H1_9BACI|nr:hypothetical protein [Alkalibacillus haloalkaliphilus]MDV2581212.1 hypothetical protein [Alkalibacillus haloalkaliphilus]GEN45898.1 hypothetical protein AHA02nite_16740 [Alkalibacillus haloalkaliphilus]
MFVVCKRRMANEKVNNLRNGYSAYAETEELIRLMKRRINSNNLDIYEDQTDIGCWFIPRS